MLPPPVGQAHVSVGYLNGGNRDRRASYLPVRVRASREAVPWPSTTPRLGSIFIYPGTEWSAPNAGGVFQRPAESVQAALGERPATCAQPAAASGELAGNSKAAGERHASITAAKATPTAGEGEDVAGIVGPRPQALFGTCIGLSL